MTSSEKPAGPLGRHYKLMWDINHTFESTFHPPMAPETVGMAQFAEFEGRAVDAFVVGIGPDAGYVTSFKSRKTQMEYLVDRYERGATLGDMRYFNHAENMKQSWQAGIDPLGIYVDEAKRVGVDHWFRISMNDWHHVDTSSGSVYRLGGSKFYEERLDLLIGEEGAAGWSKYPHLQKTMTWMQDYAHDEVRALRRDTAIEVCERYDCTGFLFDFMRVPGFFRFGEERDNAHLITQLLRETRAGLDEVGKTRGRHVGLAVRVPTTINGAQTLGLDVDEWITEELVDVLITTPFFAQDMEHDTGEWVELGRNSRVSIIAGLEEGYLAGHTDGMNRWFYNPPLMTGLTTEMVRGLAARHHARGVDGLFVFNWFGSALTYGAKHDFGKTAVNDVADPERLRYRDKTYSLMRSNDSWPNFTRTKWQIPTKITEDVTELTFDVADDVSAAGDLVRSCRLILHIDNMSVVDELEVTLNGSVVPLVNRLQPGTRIGTISQWQIYDLLDHRPLSGTNTVTVHALRLNQRTAPELPMSIEDAEIEVRYEHPTGDVANGPGGRARLSHLALAGR